MAAQKRKAEVAANGASAKSKSPKKSESTATAPPAKKQRKTSDKSSSKPENESQRSLPKTSLLKEEERSFPRGGAGVLTPLETKQIQAQAARDALFEEATGKKRQATTFSGEDGEAQDEDSDDAAVSDAPDQTATKSKKHKKTVIKKAVLPAKPKVVKDRADGLNPKKLIPGALVLGQISSVKNSGLTLDLPNGLTGNVSIVSISSQLNGKLQALVDQEEKEDDDSDDDVDVTGMFSIGQYLRASVVSPTDEASKKRSIELSVLPNIVNKGLEASQLTVGTAVQASVVSVEDHGLVMDIGLDDADRKGFVSSKQIPDGFNYGDIQTGMVFLCFVTGTGSNSRVVKLNANHKIAGDAKKGAILSDASTVDVFLPGSAVDVLITRVSSTSIFGQLLGSLEATADIVHTGSGPRNTPIESKFPVGSKARARVIYVIPDANGNRVGVSLLDHVMTLSVRSARVDGKDITPLQALPARNEIKSAKVIGLEPNLGVYLDSGIKGLPVFVHISRLSDDRVESISTTSGQYRIGSTHPVRVLGYNSVDGLYSGSMQDSVLKQTYLGIEDVPVGDVVKGTVEKIIVNANGVGGLIVQLSKGVSGLVPVNHMSDVKLQHPERKFREGLSVTARVLGVDLDEKRIRLTLKKTLVNSDLEPWTQYAKIELGSTSLGTIIKFTSGGAVVQFYGEVRGFLPTAEMSDSFIEDPTKHFSLGQTVSVHALNVDPDEQRLSVSCRLPSATSAKEQDAFDKLSVGALVSATVIKKSGDELGLTLEPSGLRAILPLGHLSDGSESKSNSVMKKLRVGQTLQDLLVIDKMEKKRVLLLSNKPSLIEASRAGKLPAKFSNIKEGKQYAGFIGNITDAAIFVRFAAGLTGLLPRTLVSEEFASQNASGPVKNQSINTTILSLDHAQQRFTLTMKSSRKADVVSQSPAKPPTDSDLPEVVNPVDESSSSLLDFVAGKLTKARIQSVKDTQLNVHLADNVQGRIDVSELFTSLEEIKDRKYPLRSFHAKDIIPVRVLGIHDARNHRFLPISHRVGKVPVFELSAKVDNESRIDSLDQLQVGDSHLAFVNNVTNKCLWVNISPNVRGRLDRMDVSGDVSVINNLEANFPVGSVLRVFVKKVDAANERLDLSIKSDSSEDDVTLDSLTAGKILAGRVTKSTDRTVLVQLSPTVVGSIGMTELADDYDKAKPSNYNKNDIIRVVVLRVDKSNKKITLSARPSRVIGSSLPVKDASITDLGKLKVNDVVRGFIKNVADVGLFVSLSDSVTAFVRVSELSDAFIKEWKAEFQVDQLVKGKIIAVDSATNHVQMSLKQTVVSTDFVPMLTFNDLQVGMVVTGKVRKVEDFGAFIVIDNSHNVSGLCHRSEIAEKRVEDVRKLYNPGDAVKAIVLKIDNDTRRLSLGLKASYFEAHDSEDEEGFSSEDEDGGVAAEEGSDDEDDEDVEMVDDLDDDDDESGIELDAEDIKALVNGRAAKTAKINEDDEEDDDEGLDAGGFDFGGAMTAAHAGDSDEDSDDAETQQKKKKKRKAEIKQDLTGELDAHGPRTASDFERLLLTSRNSSALWIQYMAFHLELSEIDKAREIAERALKTVHISEQEEKMNIWIALLSLENSYGTDETLEDAFRRACEHNEPQEMHERLINIYLEGGAGGAPRTDKAEQLFQAMLRRKGFTKDPNLWLNYASFLFNSMKDPSRGQELLPRAMQSVPQHLHVDLTMKFARLEFKSPQGNPERGRTLFENLFSTFAGKGDIWDVLIDLEKGRGEIDNVRELYARMVRESKMKSKRAKTVFARWKKFEQEQGNPKGVAKAEDAEQLWFAKKQADKDAAEAAADAE